MRVGSTQVLKADVRLIAATNRNPLRAVASGKLREDLLCRLNVFPIHLPGAARSRRRRATDCQAFPRSDRRA
jgi:transcriptional regulator with PAS, ATPase and Fis domain